MRYLVFIPALTLAFAAQGAEPAKPPVDGAKVASACGGEVTDVEMARMSAAARKAKLSCFTRVAADGMNKTLPKQIDASTVLDKVVASGTELTYVYKVNFEAASLKPGAFDAFKPTIVQKVCGAPDMAKIISVGGSYRYNWFDPKGVLVGEVLVTSC